MTERVATRSLTAADAADALVLYNQLTLGPPSNDTAAYLRVIEHAGTQIIGAVSPAGLVAMVTLHVLPNVTWTARPYALIENVVTRSDQRQKGYGRLVMEAACTAAWEASAYKIMLLTGQKRGAKGFYTSVGFSEEDKFAMVKRRP